MDGVTGGGIGGGDLVGYRLGELERRLGNLEQPVSDIQQALTRIEKILEGAATKRFVSYWMLSLVTANVLALLGHLLMT